MKTNFFKFILMLVFMISTLNCSSGSDEMDSSEMSETNIPVSPSPLPDFKDENPVINQAPFTDEQMRQIRKNLNGRYESSYYVEGKKQWTDISILADVYISIEKVKIKEGRLVIENAKRSEYTVHFPFDDGSTFQRERKPIVKFMIESVDYKYVVCLSPTIENKVIGLICEPLEDPQLSVFVKYCEDSEREDEYFFTVLEELVFYKRRIKLGQYY